MKIVESEDIAKGKRIKVGNIIIIGTKPKVNKLEKEKELIH